MKQESQAWAEINRAIRERIGLDDGVYKIVNEGVSARDVVDILTTRFHELPSKSMEREMVIRCLIEKGLTEATPFLLSLYDEPEPPLSHMVYVGEALAEIGDPTAYERICRVIRLKKRWHEPYALFAVVAKKKTQESYNILVEALGDGDPHVRISAIEALSKFGEQDAVPLIEATAVDNPEVPTQNRELQRRKQKALDKLSRRAANHEKRGGRCPENVTVLGGSDIPKTYIEPCSSGEWLSRTLRMLSARLFSHRRICETSTNLDMENVEPFLSRIGKNIPKGFGPAVVTFLCRMLRDINEYHREQAVAVEIELNGSRAKLIVVLLRHDDAEIDLAFYSTPTVIATVDGVISCVE